MELEKDSIENIRVKVSSQDDFLNLCRQHFQGISVKWPQCLIVGKKTTEKYAMEVIRRSDNFFQSLNVRFIQNEQTKQFILKKLNFPDEDTLPMPIYIDEINQWLKRWGTLDLSYLTTKHILSHSIHGDNGWIELEGSIFHTHNIGKHPSSLDVFRDCLIIAETFPELEFMLLTMNHEENEKEAAAENCELALEVCRGEVFVYKNPKEGFKVLVEKVDSGHFGDFKKSFENKTKKNLNLNEEINDKLMKLLDNWGQRFK